MSEAQRLTGVAICAADQEERPESDRKSHRYERYIEHEPGHVAGTGLSAGPRSDRCLGFPKLSCSHLLTVEKLTRGD